MVSARVPLYTVAWMRHCVSAGTDVAQLCFFDPKALPENFDAEMRTPFRTGKLLEECNRNGRLFLINTGADGSYLLHAYVDEPVPDYLQPHLHDPITLPGFPVVSGTVCFSGAEYTYRDDDKQFRKYKSGGEFPLPPGMYEIQFFRTKIPTERMHEELDRRAPHLRTTLWGGFSALELPNSLGCVALLATVAAGFTLLRWTFAQAWPAFLAAFAAWAALVAYTRWPRYREIRRAWEKLEYDFPTMIAIIKPTPESNVYHSCD